MLEICKVMKIILLFGRIIKTLLFEAYLSENFLGAFSDLLNKNKL